MKISVNERKRKAMGEEKVTIKIGVDTTELNQKLDESIKSNGVNGIATTIRNNSVTKN